METRGKLEALPPIENGPSLDEELKHYHQHDLMPSHIYRVGMKIFGKKPPIRKRVIDASTAWRPSPLTPSSQPLHKVTHIPILSPAQNTMPTTLDYKAWIGRRKEMRETLDSIGAHEQWLSSKDCTPIEATLLEKLRRERIERNRIQTPPTPSEVSASDDEELTAAELRWIRLMERKNLLRDISRLEKLLKTCRMRIADLVVPYDANQTYLVPTDLLLDCLERYIVPPSIPLQSTITLCDALEKETGEGGSVIDYRKLFQPSLEDVVLRYVTQKEERKKPLVITEDESIMSLNSSSFTEDDSETLSTFSGSSCGLMDERTLSTMNGERGVWSSEFKNDAQKQFLSLVEYCHKNNIVLDKKLAKRGLLIPPDKKRQHCLRSLRQPGTILLSRDTVMPPKESDGDSQGSEMSYTYGWQYQQLRGPTKSKLLKLSTGVARIRAKTDTWMTFPEFEELTREIQSRPGFNYKYHGLPSNSSFWPGALEDKLRFYLPQDTKTCSVAAIFHPVHHRMRNNSIGPLPSDRGGVWPENDSGYVQLGSSLARTKKSYIA